MPPAVALLNFISCGILWRIFGQTGTFRGVFSTYHWYHRIHPRTVIFCGFFLFIVRRKDQRSCDVRGGSTRVYAPASELFPPLHPLIRMWVCLPPWIQRGGSHTLLQWGGGSPMRTTGIEGLALCVLSGLGNRVERKRTFTRAAWVR